MSFEDDLAAALDGYTPTSLDRMLVDGDALFARVPVPIDEVETDVREGNDCNLPAGDSDGGRWGRNDDPRCSDGGLEHLPPGFLEGSLIKDPLYHGTSRTFKGGLLPNAAAASGRGEFGIYLSTSRQYASQYGAKTHKVLVNIQRPLIVEGKHEVSPADLTQADAERLQAQGYDSVVVSQDGTLSGAQEVVVFNPRQTYLIREARIREYNDCNLPGGDSDGGQWGANSDPRCAGGAGSLHHGPVRPPRGKALARFNAQQADPAPAAQGGQSEVHQRIFGKLRAEDRAALMQLSFGGPVIRESMVIFHPETGERIPPPVRSPEQYISKVSWSATADGQELPRSEVWTRTEEAMAAGYLLGSAYGVPVGPEILDAGTTVHTHPNSGVFSGADVVIADRHRATMGVLGQDGSEYALRITDTTPRRIGHTPMVTAMWSLADRHVLNMVDYLTASILLDRNVSGGFGALEKGQEAAAAKGWTVEAVHADVHSLVRTGILRAMAKEGWLEYDEKITPALQVRYDKHTGGRAQAIVDITARFLKRDGPVRFNQAEFRTEVLRAGRSRGQRADVRNAATTEARRRLTEFNPCHEPAGSSDGGRFTFKGTGNCDGDGTPTFRRGGATLTITANEDNWPIPWVDAAGGAEAIARTMLQHLDGAWKVSVTTMPARHGRDGATLLISASHADGSYLRRDLYKERDGTLVASHQHFENHGKAHQGFALMQGQMEAYEQLSVARLDTTANISTGAYAWARYGFLATDPRGFANTVRDRATGNYADLKTLFTGDMVAALQPYLPEIEAALKTPTGQTPWAVSDLRVTGTPKEMRKLAEVFAVKGNGVFRHTVKTGTRWNLALRADADRGVFNLGRALLTGLSWGATLSRDDTASMKRLRAYLRGDKDGRKGKEPAGGRAQTGAPQPWVSSRAKEAALREYNDCNLPGGDFDGGRWGANADPRCAGGIGSLYHGPVRPPRGKALTRFKQRQATRMLRREPDAFVPPSPQPRITKGDATPKEAPKKARRVLGVTSHDTTTTNTPRQTYTAKSNIRDFYAEAQAEATSRRLTGMSARELAEAYTKYLDEPVTVTISAWSESELSIQIKGVNPNAAGSRTNISRSIKQYGDDDPKTVYHSYFRNNGPDGQGKGLMRAQIELYEQIGVDSFTTGANINTGAYAWARYGFASDEPNDFGSGMTRRANELQRIVGSDVLGNAFLTHAVAAAASGTTAPWALSDLRITGEPEDLQRLKDALTIDNTVSYHPLRGFLSLSSEVEIKRWNDAIAADHAAGVVNLGRAIMTGGAWHAKFDMKDAEQRERLKRYVGDWTDGAQARPTPAKAPTIPVTPASAAPSTQARAAAALNAQVRSVQPSNASTPPKTWGDVPTGVNPRGATGSTTVFRNWLNTLAVGTELRLVTPKGDITRRIVAPNDPERATGQNPWSRVDETLHDRLRNSLFDKEERAGRTLASWQWRAPQTSSTPATSNASALFIPRAFPSRSGQNRAAVAKPGAVWQRNPNAAIPKDTPMKRMRADGTWWTGPAVGGWASRSGVKWAQGSEYLYKFPKG